MDLTQRLKQLHKTWPDLRWDCARLIERDHDVVILDDAFVFRFECQDPEHEPLGTEVCFLQSLRERADIEVPNYTRVQDGFRVAGYPIMPGDPLTLRRWAEFTCGQQRQVVLGMAEILDAVHGFPLPEAQDLGILPTSRPDAEMLRSLDLYSRMVRRGHLTEPEVAYCDSIVRASTNTGGLAEMPSCVIHGDIEPPHMLHSGEQFTGVIDFGDVAIGDPAADFGFLWELGEQFVDGVIENYSRPPDALKQRSHWWWFGRAIKLMEWAGVQQIESRWERGYALFPSGVANPRRAKGCWRAS